MDQLLLVATGELRANAGRRRLGVLDVVLGRSGGRRRRPHRPLIASGPGPFESGACGSGVRVALSARSIRRRGRSPRRSSGYGRRRPRRLRGRIGGLRPRDRDLPGGGRRKPVTLRLARAGRCRPRPRRRGSRPRGPRGRSSSRACRPRSLTARADRGAARSTAPGAAGGRRMREPSRGRPSGGPARGGQCCAARRGDHVGRGAGP